MRILDTYRVTRPITNVNKEMRNRFPFNLCTFNHLFSNQMCNMTSFFEFLFNL